MVNKYDNYELKKVNSLENVPGTIKDGDGYIWDPSELPSKDFDDSKVPLNYRRLAIWMRSKLFGKDVRETIARLAEMFGLNFKELMASFKSLDNRQDALETQTAQSVAQMEADKNAVIANATVDSEVILARGGKPTLQVRLDDTDNQLAQTVNRLAQTAKVVNVHEFVTVQEAVDFANEYDILHFSKGVHEFADVKISKSLTISGEGILRKNDQSKRLLIFDGGNFITIKNVTIDGDQQGAIGHADIVVTNVGELVVDGVTFTNMAKTGLDISTNTGKAIVRNSIFKEGKSAGFDSSNASTTYHLQNNGDCDITVTGCTFKTTIPYVEGVSRSPIAIFSTKAKNIVVHNNKLINSGHIDLYSENHYAIVTNNRVDNCHWNPIKVQECYFSNISDNIITNTKGERSAIVVQPYARIASYGSLTINKGYGFIKDNLIDHSHMGIQVNGNPISPAAIERNPQIKQSDILAKGYSIIGNIIRNTGHNGIFLRLVEDIDIQQNTIVNYGGSMGAPEINRSGILLDFLSGTINVNDNIIKNSSKVGSFGITNTSGLHVSDTIQVKLNVQGNTIEKTGRTPIYFNRLSDLNIKENDITSDVVPKIRVLDSNNLTILNNTGFDNENYENTAYSTNTNIVTDSRKRGTKNYYLPSPPTNGTFIVGDIVYKTTPVANQPIGWVCVEAGSPGIWKGFGHVSG